MKISEIYRYPIKGLKGTKISAASITHLRGLAGDRQFAIAHSGGVFSSENPQWIHRRNFLNIAHCPKLATLETQFNENKQTIEVRLRGEKIYSGEFKAGPVNSELATIFEGCCGAKYPAPYYIAALDNKPLTDSPISGISILNEHSLFELSQHTGRPIEKERFRANVWLNDCLPWHEFDLIGKELRIGQATVKIIEPITRCAAIDTHPDTGERDLPLLSLLHSEYGHTNFGVLAQIVNCGTLAAGQNLSPLD